MSGPPIASFLEPSTRTLVIDWTPTRIRQAEIMADAGDFRLAADLCDAMLADDAVQAALGTVIHALLGCELSFEEGEGRTKKRAVRALEAEEDFYAAFPEDVLVDMLRWAILLNVSPGYLAWAERAGKGRVVPYLQTWHPRNLRYDVILRSWFMRVDDGVKEVPFTPGDGTWMLHTPRGRNRPWMFGAWRAVARWWLLKHYARLDWGQYSQRQGQGLFVGYAPADVKKENRAALATDLQSLGRTTGIALPPGYDIKIVESIAKTWETFQAQIAVADKGITVALTNLNVTNETGGSYAKAKSLGGIRTEIITGYGESLGSMLHDQALVYWAEFNFGAAKLAPWPKWETEDEEDEVANATVDKTRADAATALAGVGIFTINEVRRAAGLEPLATGGDELVKPASPPAQATPPAPAPAAAPPEKKPKKAAKANATAKDGIRLRSGHAVSAQSGFVQGQIYADAVADHTRDGAAEALRPDLEAVLAAIEAGDSYTDIRERLLKAYRDMDPEKLAKLTEAALTMAELGGRHAMNEDINDG